MFGEYLVLNEGAAISIPYPDYNCHWEKGELENSELYDFMAYLKISGMESSLDLDKMEKDLEDGWNLLSTIPRGSGLGSSGAVVAAVYDRYAHNKVERIEDLQAVFSDMEHFMHGKSSGFDPLTSFLGKPILMKNKQGVVIKTELSFLSQWNMELINSGKERQASDLIDRYIQSLESQEEFTRRIQVLTKVNNKIIDALIRNELVVARDLIRSFSQNQLEIFNDWIPGSIRRMWEEDLHSDDRIMKLLGAGGGGYFLRIRF